MRHPVLSARCEYQHSKGYGIGFGNWREFEVLDVTEMKVHVHEQRSCREDREFLT